MEQTKKIFFADMSLIYTAAVWGSTFVIAKESLKYVNPIAMVGHRFILAAVVMAVICAVLKKNPFQNIKQGAVLGFFMALIYIPQTVGLKYTEAAHSGFITGLFIVFVPIMAYILFKEKPTHAKILSVMMAVSGLFLLTGGLRKMNIGDMMTLVTAFACAMHILMGDKLMKRGIDPVTACFQQFLITGVIGYIAGIVTGYGFQVSDVIGWEIILVLALFPSVSGFLIQMAAQKFTSSIKVAAIFSLEPVFAALFAWTIGGERATFYNIAGGGLIVAGMIAAELPLEKIFDKK